MDTKANKMLIDATHPEETRVVVLRNGRVEEFDFESAARAQLRGNIYLAKVTRVEPSLQAAFVEYGGNRHGFLAFNEIHPDYYQIPMADKQALLEEEARAEAEADAEADARAERRAGRQRHADQPRDHDNDSDNGDLDGDNGIEPVAAEGAASLNGDGGASYDEETRSAALDVRRDDPVLIELPPPATEEAAAEPIAESQDSAPSLGGGLEDATVDDDRPSGDHIEEVADVGEAPEVIGAGAVEDNEDDVVEEVQERPRRPRRRTYKIQEVIKRRQVILVQVVKEERGNKGAALTTYLSLAGRYTVLMPNTGRGGGISRKITNAVDRKRLKSIAQELDVPEGMGLIIRTAGAARTNQEIKRDYEYLLRLWESVRELTLNSTAPSLVYEEGNLIKRSIRDLYSKEIDEIVVAGEHAYAEAVDFMRMLMPSHAKNVIRHTAPEALFARYQIERQLNAFFSPQVTLRSGGYIVINQTEALVAIDVNSGKSTREYSIEETALNTNLEAADEIARQLKLRDLAGLIVVDFIDMEEKRNNRAVERRLKDALRFDRARIQVGRISHFGLLEMSRQRMRTGMLEGSTSQCPHCLGTGMIRSTESVALAVLRGLEDHLNKDPRSSVTVLTTAQVALYILNNKRQFISEIEDRFGVAVAVQASERMHGANYAIERSSAPPPVRRAPVRPAVNMDWGFEDDDNEPPSETASNVDFVETNDDDYDRRPSERRQGE
ncbi:MAG TPA: ribonuclease E/G, partial [Hyphomicrobiaceae bacterium]|nr:ribonuclease E/G [Hyphomicrobiaceae bacterium]